MAGAYQGVGRASEAPSLQEYPPTDPASGRSSYRPCLYQGGGNIHPGRDNTHTSIKGHIEKWGLVVCAPGLQAEQQSLLHNGPQITR